MIIEIVDLKSRDYKKQRLENRQLIRLVPAFGYRINDSLIVLSTSKTQVILGSFILGEIFKISYKDYYKYIKNFSSQTFIPQILIDLNIVSTETKHLRIPQSTTYFRNLQLNLTPNCNLRCRYCYAMAGRKSDHQAMPFEIAKKAIDYVSNFCGDELHLRFIGEGESTTEFPLLKRIFNYAKTKVDKVTINPMSTNGVIPISTADWLIKNTQIIQISCDGPAFIQNKYRPLADGSKSSPLVEKTIKYFVKKKKYFRVRATMTKDFFGNELKIVNYFWQLGVRDLSFGPLEDIGAAQIMVQRPGFEQTIKLSRLESLFQEFNKLIELQNELGIRIGLLNFRLLGTTVTCSLYTKSILVVDPHGDASTCDRHNDISDFAKYPFMKDFMVGGYDFKAKKFKIDLKKVEDLKNKINHQLSINKCNNCSLLSACSTICLYALGQKTGKLDPAIPTCGKTEKIAPTITFKYFAERYLINKKPCLEFRGNKLFFSLLYTDFELAFSENGRHLTKNPYIIIEDVTKLGDCVHNIIDYKNKRDELTTFLINFQLKSTLPNKDTGNKVVSFLETLKKNKVYYKVTEPLPQDLFGKDYMDVCQRYSLPVNYKDCLELYRVMGGKVFFSQDHVGTKKISEYEDREEIYKDFLLLQKSNYRNRLI